MIKEEIKAIIFIVIVLLLTAGLAFLGIYIYMMQITIIEEEQIYEGNITILSPFDKEEKKDKETSNQNILGNIEIEPTPEGVKDEKEYYYKQLNEYSKIIYDELAKNKENLKTGTYKIDFGDAFNELLSQENGAQLLQENYQSGMETYLYDNPDVFYLDPTKMYINIQTTKKLFTTTYEVFIDQGTNSNYLAEGYTSKEQILKHEEQIEQEVQKILEKVQGKTDYQKILTIHDYLVDNVAYEQTVTKHNIYNMYGALVNKEAVCEGYAKAFKYLMDRAGIKCIVVIGVATDSKSETQNHAWNYVELAGVWYGIDVTWDDPKIIGGGRLGKNHRYKYFLKSNSTMSKDHVESSTFVDGGKEYTHPVLSNSDY